MYLFVEDDDDGYDTSHSFFTEEQSRQFKENLTYCLAYKKLVFNGKVAEVYQDDLRRTDAIKIVLNAPFPTLLDSAFLMVDKDTIFFDYPKNVFHVGDPVLKEQGNRTFVIIQEEKNVKLDLMKIEGKDYCKLIMPQP